MAAERDYWRARALKAEQLVSELQALQSTYREARSNPDLEIADRDTAVAILTYLHGRQQSG